MAIYHNVHSHYVIGRTPDEVEADHHMNVAARVIYLAGGVIIGLLAIRFLLALLGANPGNAFASFIYDVSYPLAAPFFGLFSFSPALGRSQFELGTLIAMVVYALLTELVVRLTTIANHHDEA